MFSLILGKDRKFFEMFEKGAVNVSAGAQALSDLLQDYPAALGEKANHIKEVEHQGDLITHQTIEMLNKTFITPIDREDIYELITKLDDILDLMDGAASRLALYKIQYVTEESIDFGKILTKATELLLQGTKALRDIKKNHHQIIKSCVEIHTLENEGDTLMRKAMFNLFENKKDDPVYIIKWKEIYQDLETATDRCEDVANIMEGIVLKYA